MLNETKNSQLALLTEEPTATVVISGSCSLRTQDGESVVFVHGVPAFNFHVDDEIAARLAAVQLYDLGHASIVELQRLADCDKRSLFRARQAWLDGGAAALTRKKRGPKGPRLGKTREQSIRRWQAQGVRVAEMARRLRVDPGTVRNALIRMGLPTSRRQAAARQQELLAAAESAAAETAAAESENAEIADATVVPTPSGDAAQTALSADASTAPEAVNAPTATLVAPAPIWSPGTLDTDPDDRSFDRLLAYKGELVDAAPLFKTRLGLSRVGVLLAVPLIVQSGVLQAARQVYGDIGPAFYGLRTSLMTLLFMALLRIKNPESLKRYNPAELGWLLGLDRAPEMKTVRRKLLHLGDEPVPTETFLREVVQRRVHSRQQALGFLYVDGHVRVYTGKAEVPKAHVARMRISMPATQEVWVNDADGAPLFFVTQEAHGQLVSELPGVLAEVREQLGDNRRVTVVFDRGGWSPALFARMNAGGFDVLTYRKGKAQPVPVERFATFEVPGSHGREQYELADTEIEVGSGSRRLQMRQVTRRTVNSKGEEHQTHIVTTRRDLPAEQVAWRMFARWRQENFFKYMRQQFAIDALVQYGTEDANPGREVPNPAHKAASKELAKARRALVDLQAQYGDALANNVEQRRRTVRGLKIATGKTIGAPLRAAQRLVDELSAKRKELPQRVPIGSVREEVVRLARSRKRLSDGLKMLAYQLETDLVTLVAPHYARALDEGRPLVTSALQSRGDIEVRGDELWVTLAPQASPHRTRAIAALCADLDATDTRFPGTALRLRFGIVGADRDTASLF